ncbi:hypothetical protein BaRGS_00009469 [Batillaria attramentaria]|uniref:Uncharacterized protein n=1 Tax=Batillaria attramentaria TaxID=370345 RepID=A0ABD0LJQ7_9CAEN
MIYVRTVQSRSSAWCVKGELERTPVERRTSAERQDDSQAGTTHAVWLSSQVSRILQKNTGPSLLDPTKEHRTTDTGSVGSYKRYRSMIF